MDLLILCINCFYRPSNLVTGIQEVARSPPPPFPRQVVDSPAPSGSDSATIPGETEEDGMLRREYVLVGDTRAVEINRTVDGALQLIDQSFPFIH